VFIFASTLKFLNVLCYT